jgi:hypothetical protein
MKRPSLAQAVLPAAAPAPHVLAAHAAVNGEQVVRLSINIPADLHKAVKLRATEDGRSLRDVVLELLSQYVKR